MECFRPCLHWGYYNRVPYIKPLGLIFKCLNNKHLLFTVLEPEKKTKIKVSAYLVSGEGSFPGLQMTVFSRCPHMAEWGSELFLIKVLILSWGFYP